MTKKQCIEHFGSGVAVAAALDINRSAVTLWGKYPPDGRQAQLEIMTDGALLSEATKRRRAAETKLKKAS